MSVISSDRGRIPRHDYFMAMACLVAMRSTCARRHTGCVLIDEHQHVMATGYNGVPAGLHHCNDLGARNHVMPPDIICPGGSPGNMAQVGQGLDKCWAIHAEQNAILQCGDTMAIRTAYCTTAPCIQCVKLLLNTGCNRVIFMDQYHPESKQLWSQVRDAHRWEQLPMSFPFLVPRPFNRVDSGPVTTESKDDCLR